MKNVYMESLIVDGDFSHFFLSTVVGSILLSVMSAFLFILILLSTFKAKLKISKNICCINQDCESIFYVFKIVNKSPYDLYDVTIKLEKMIPVITNYGNKINYKLEELRLSADRLDHFSRNKHRKNEADHALQIRTFDDVKSCIENKQMKLKLTVTAKHSFSNLTSVVSQTFNHRGQLHENKDFVYGSSLDVL